MNMSQKDPFKSFMKLFLYGAWKNNIPLMDVLGIDGNIKVPKTTAIFNMSSAKDCPSRKLGLCKAIVDGKCICYAQKSERNNRSFVLPYRRRQEKFWKKIDAENFCVQFLAISITRHKPFTALRFNEAGDFHSQQCVNKAERIARILKPYGVTCYCYTSRDDLDYSNVKSLVISGSGFKKKGIKNIFKIIKNKNDRPKGYGICPMNCHSCDRCLKSGLKTAVVKH